MAISKKLLIIICALFICVVAALFFFPQRWQFEKTSVATCKLLGQQGGVKLSIWENERTKNSGIRITGPNKFESLFYPEISWSGVKTLKPTCQSFSFTSYTDKVASGIGEGRLNLRVQNGYLTDCKTNKGNVGNAISAILRQEGNIQVFDPNNTRVAKFTVYSDEKEVFDSFWNCKTR